MGIELVSIVGITLATPDSVDRDDVAGWGNVDEDRRHPGSLASSTSKSMASADRADPSSGIRIRGYRLTQANTIEMSA